MFSCLALDRPTAIISPRVCARTSRTVFAFTLCLLLLLWSFAAHADVRSGLVAEWNYDAETLNDTSGGSRHGTATGNVSFITDGASGSALRLDGAPYDKSYVAVAGDGGLALRDWTLATWVRLPYYHVLGNIMFFGKQESSYLYNYGLFSWPDGRISASYEATDSASHHTLTSPAPIPTDTWTHIVATRDSATGAHRLFINGDLVASGTWSDTPADAISPFLIGRATQADLNVTVKADFDESRVYNRALSEAEVRELYANKAASKAFAHMLWRSNSSGADKIYYAPIGEDRRRLAKAKNLSGKKKNDRKPDLYVKDGIVHAIWENADSRSIIYRRSDDGGATWTSRATLEAGNAPHAPRIAVNKLYSSNEKRYFSFVHTVWYDTSDTGQRRIRWKRGRSGGKDWSYGGVIFSDADGRLVNPDIAVDSNHVFVVWERQKGGRKRDIFLRRSSSNGSFWHPSQKLIQDRQVGSPKMAISHPYVHVVWEELIDGVKTVRYMRSTDNGVTWTAERKVCNDCFAPEIALTSKGKRLHITWAAEMPDANRDIKYRYYREKADGGWARLKTPINVAKNATSSLRPTLATKGKDVFIAWDDPISGDRDIMSRLSRDQAKTWSNKMRVVTKKAQTDVSIAFNDTSKTAYRPFYLGRFNDFKIHEVGQGINADGLTAEEQIETKDALAQAILGQLTSKIPPFSFIPPIETGFEIAGDFFAAIGATPVATFHIFGPDGYPLENWDTVPKNTPLPMYVLLSTGGSLGDFYKTRPAIRIKVKQQRRSDDGQVTYDSDTVTLTTGNTLKNRLESGKVYVLEPISASIGRTDGWPTLGSEAYSEGEASSLFFRNAETHRVWMDLYGFVDFFNTEGSTKKVFRVVR